MWGNGNEPWFDTAQVCLNGHTITHFAKSDLEYRKDFCPTCGAGTIDRCREFIAEIQGKRHVPGLLPARP
jgi:hypothetical protein